MKKNIIIALLSAISILLLIFSLYQKSQTDISTDRAYQIQRQAEEMQMEARIKNEHALQPLTLANQQLAEVLHQLKITEEELKKIKK